MGQKAAWAIRTCIETRPDYGALDDHSDRLKEIRDILTAMVGGGEGDAVALQSELSETAETIETGSGAPIADSVALRAAVLITGHSPNFAEAAEQLTIGLPAAQ